MTTNARQDSGVAMVTTNRRLGTLLIALYAALFIVAVVGIVVLN